MKNIIFKVVLLTTFIFTSCSKKQAVSERLHSVKVVEAKGYKIPNDSLIKPTPIVINNDKLIKKVATIPKIVSTNLNKHPAGVPKINLAGKPRIYTPGKDTLLLPSIIILKDSHNLAGIPEIIQAKDMAMKEQNSQSFSFFKKLQGLKHDNIKCLTEDKFGNLWFGTNGGGISKYDGKSFTHYTNKEGLCGNIVWDILEDRKGNIWIATFGGGVCKFDGKNFSYINQATGLSSNNVLSLFEDQKGNLWIATDGGGVCKFDGQSITNYNEKNGLISNSIREVFEDKKGNIWFTSEGSGAAKFDGSNFTHYTVNEGLSSNDVWSITEDNIGNIWFGTNGNGIIKFDGKTFSIYTVKEGLNHNTVISSLKDNEGNLWFGTYNGGVCKFDGKMFTHYQEIDGLSNNDVWSILQDKSNNFWFGTNGGGLCKYSGNNFNHFTVKDGLSSNIIRSIIEDKNKNLWLGSDKGLIKYDGKGFSNFLKDNGILDQEILSLMEDHSGNIWIGTNTGGVCRYNGFDFTYLTKNEGLLSNRVWCITEDRKGNFWFGTENGITKYDGKSLLNFTQKEGINGKIIKSMYLDKNDNLWFGSMNGLTKYDGKIFTHFNENNGLSNSDIRTIFEDNIGNIWFGTYGGGISVFNGSTFTHLTEKEGLCNNFIFSSLQDTIGNYWFGTRFGLSKLEKKKAAELFMKIKTNKIKEGEVYFKNFVYEDGFLGIGCVGNSLCLSKSKKIWIGANDRLTTIHPSNIQSNTQPPDIQLTNIDLYNENVPWLLLSKNIDSKFQSKDTAFTLGNGVPVKEFTFDDLSNWYNIPLNLVLPYNNNYLSFGFIGITQHQSNEVKYQYMLEGIDENWSAISNKTSAPYGNLPPGKYTFKVKAMNSDGYWSEPIAYEFSIRPPFWQTWWFRIILVIVVIMLVWLYIKTREKKLVEEKENLEKVVEKRTFELIEKQNEIIDSINYAQRIQRSLLLSEKQLNNHLQNYFILYKPKAIVSGDFYWGIKPEKDLHANNFLLLIGDSTGHGVPGAIMSMLNISCLEKAIEVEKLINPAEILNYTRSKIINILNKDGSLDGGKDGMDCSLILFDFDNKKLIYAAANNPIWIVRENQLIELNADKMPVGRHDKQNLSFTQHEIAFQKDDMVYALTDGFADQFGGLKGKKFMSKKLRELLVNISNLPLQQQKTILDETFVNWAGNLEQVDDVTILGLRL